MVAVVTGASSGMGRRITERLLAEGVRVAGLSRTEEIDKNFLSIACDLREEVQVGAAIDRVVAELGGVDILVNAAGVSMPEFLDLSSIEPALWRRIVDTNLTGAFNILHFTMPHLRKKGGYIVNILSTASFRSIVGNAPYSASKYGARALTETAALEGKECGVRVSSISPGPVNTPIWSHKKTPPDAEKRAMMLDVEDIADIALFLLKAPGNVVIENITVTPQG